VGVEERREGVQAGGVDLLAAIGELTVTGVEDLGDPPGPDQQVALAVESGARVERVRAADQQVLAGAAAPVERPDLAGLGPELIDGPAPTGLRGRGRSPPASIS
jgi:hypothetical protein